jgi:hypothetical protein
VNTTVCVQDEDGNLIDGAAVMFEEPGLHEEALGGTALVNLEDGEEYGINVTHSEYENETTTVTGGEDTTVTLSSEESLMSTLLPIAV